MKFPQPCLVSTRLIDPTQNPAYRLPPLLQTTSQSLFSYSLEHPNKGRFIILLVTAEYAQTRSNYATLSQHQAQFNH